MKQCGCNPIPEQFEFPIIDDNIKKYKFDFGTNSQDLCQLKYKIICDFQDVIKSLECGIQPDLELLLQEISLIYINDERRIVFYK